MRFALMERIPSFAPRRAVLWLDGADLTRKCTLIHTPVISLRSFVHQIIT